MRTEKDDLDLESVAVLPHKPAPMMVRPIAH